MKINSTTIKLHELHFYGYHGVTSEEQAVGSHFTINACLTINATADSFLTDELTNTINYAEAYNYIREEFISTSCTLENVATRILQRLFSEFELLQQAEVEIMKCNPPFGAQCNAASVNIKAKRYPKISPKKQ